ncbi:MAG: hypothetical protein FWG63_09430 [Defluviitaleaceae bacterium]|nr:hypothetical protein [Defluviitaleaceae bacterium]
MREVIKTILLTCLIALALFQTQELWFRNMSRGFFAVFAIQASPGDSYGEFFVAPTRILTSLGNNRFAVEYAPGTIQHLAPLFADALASQPIVTEITPDLFNGRIIIYYYNFNMPAWAFFQHFGIENHLPLQYFNQILIVPQLATNLVHISFVGEYVVSYTITTSANAALNTHIQNAHRDFGDSHFYYASSSIMGFAFDTNLFLPRWHGDTLQYTPLTVSPILSGDLIEIGQNISFFFDNPDLVRSDNRNGILTYGDFNVVVRYYNNVLEYTNHRPGSAPGNILTYFDTAMAFLTRDTNVTTPFVLQGFTTEDTYTTFYFDYVINNFPVMLADAPLDHWLQITVEQGHVTSYRKVALNLHQTQAHNYHRTDIITLVNERGVHINPTLGYIYHFHSATVGIDWNVNGEEIE